MLVQNGHAISVCDFTYYILQNAGKHCKFIQNKHRHFVCGDGSVWGGAAEVLSTAKSYIVFTRAAGKKDGNSKYQAQHS